MKKMKKMKKMLALSAFLAVLIGCQEKETPKAAVPAPKAAEAPAYVAPATAPAGSFAEVVDNMDSRKHTKMQAKEYWQKVKGREVTWSGVVYDVQGGSSKAKVYVADKSRPLHSGYNIAVVTHDIEKAVNLKKGQSLRFKGTLDDFRNKDAGGIATVVNAQIL